MLIKICRQGIPLVSIRPVYCEPPADPTPKKKCVRLIRMAVFVTNILLPKAFKC